MDSDGYWATCKLLLMSAVYDLSTSHNQKKSLLTAWSLSSTFFSIVPLQATVAEVATVENASQHVSGCKKTVWWPGLTKRTGVAVNAGVVVFLPAESLPAFPPASVRGTGSQPRRPPIPIPIPIPFPIPFPLPAAYSLRGLLLCVVLRSLGESSCLPALFLKCWGTSTTEPKGFFF